MSLLYFEGQGVKVKVSHYKVRCENFGTSYPQVSQSHFNTYDTNRSKVKSRSLQGQGQTKVTCKNCCCGEQRHPHERLGVEVSLISLSVIRDIARHVRGAEGPTLKVIPEWSSARRFALYRLHQIMLADILHRSLNRFANFSTNHQTSQICLYLF